MNQVKTQLVITQLSYTSNQFFIQIEGQTINVCKQLFLKTFQISDGRTTRAIRKMKRATWIR